MAVNATGGVVFLVYLFLCISVFIQALRLACRYHGLPGFVILPFAVLGLMYENTAIAVDLFTEESSAVLVMMSIRYIIHATLAPLLIICCFELSYVVHKTRGANFCCITFDEGHRDNSACISLARFFPWIYAFALGVVTLMASANLIANPKWNTETRRFSTEGVDFQNVGATLSGVMDIVPPLSLAVFATYTGCSLWKYGTYLSTDVSATLVNPWISVLLGAVCLVVALFVTPSNWDGPFLTNGAEVLLLFGVLSVGYRVDLNIKQMNDYSKKLQKTNRISETISNHRQNLEQYKAARKAGGTTPRNIDVLDISSASRASKILANRAHSRGVSVTPAAAAAADTNGIHVDIEAGQPPAAGKLRPAGAAGAGAGVGAPSQRPRAGPARTHNSARRARFPRRKASPGTGNSSYAARAVSR